MGLYDEIKSPLDDEETLRSIIDIYVNHRVDGGSRPVESGYDFYKGVTKYGNESQYNQNESIMQFEKYIKIPNLDRLYEKIKDLDFVRNLDEFVAQKINEIQSMNISAIEKESQIEKLKKKTLYPLSRFRPILGKFGSYHEFYDFFNEKNLWQARSIYQKIELFPSLKDEYLQELKGLGLTDKQIELSKMMSKFMDLMNNRFSGGEGSMGFHVYPQNLQITDTGIDRENADIKFYLNAGIDTYRVAQLFQRKCEQSKLNYYFKVVNAERIEEYKRSDKLCIYTEFKDAEKFLEIVREIKKENPDINFKNPPILTGKIDNFIGIGMDHIDKNKGSYNGKMSNVCYEAISDIFKNTPRASIPALIDKHPEILYKLREIIKQQAKEMGLDPEKICVKPEVKQKLEIPEHDVKDFMLKFAESYIHLETNSQYDKRLDSEESDMEYVADYVNKFKEGKLGDDRLLGIQPDNIDNYGRADFSQNNIDRMFRLLNAANNLTVGNQRYFRYFCEIPEIKRILKQMQESPAVKDMISRYKNDKKMNNPGARVSLREKTPAEKDIRLARQYYRHLNEISKSDDRNGNYILDTIINADHIKNGYESKEELALAQVCCRQRGIKTQSRLLQGKYKLDIVNQVQNQNAINQPETSSRDR